MFTHPMEYFYTVQPKSKSVTKEEFENFIKTYPRKLDYDWCAISDPPAISYNDFELANRWPYSIVARTWAYSNDPNHYYYDSNPRYYIVENYQEMFESKTGNVAE
jgi:hypothetical protein